MPAEACGGDEDRGTATVNVRLATAWFWLRSSYWFIPVLMTAAATAAALLLVGFDRSQPWSRQIPGWVYTGGAEGARSLLSAIASSMITVAGVVFSITMVALALTSSQFGPRLLTNFMRDRGNQCVLGTFVATFMYCLMVLRVVRAGPDEFVPHLAVTVALGLAGTALLVLIYFIHHVSTSIHAESVIAAVRRDLDDAIETTFGAHRASDEHDSRPTPMAPPPDREICAAPVKAPCSGYVQAIDSAALVHLAAAHDLVLRLIHRPGHFVVADNPVALASPPERAGAEVLRAIADAFVIGSVRTPTQDVEFAINQLVEIAVRALSPGINDPFTAVACVDWLGAALCKVAVYQPLPREQADGRGVVRVLAEPVTFEGLVDAAFHQIRQYGRSSAAVIIRLLEAIAGVKGHAHRMQDLCALERHADMVERAGMSLPEALDRAAVQARHRAIAAAPSGAGRAEPRGPGPESSEYVRPAARRNHMKTARWLGVAAAVIGFAAEALAVPTGADNGAPRPRRCPYDFRTAMPAGEYCVYRGVIASPGGAVCNGDAVLIWSTYGQPEARGEAAEDGAPSVRDVFFGITDEPALVLRGDAARHTQARIVDYTSDSDPATAPLDGTATLHRRQPGRGALSMTLRPPLALDTGDDDCEFGSYRGLFIGVMRLPEASAALPIAN